MIVLRNMQDFIVHHLLYTGLLTGNEFMDLTNTCKYLRSEFNNTECLKKLWKHKQVRNLKTALYVEHKLNRYSPLQIFEEACSKTKQLEVLSTFRSLRLTRRYNSLPVRFLLEKRGRVKSALGKRNKRYT